MRKRLTNKEKDLLRMIMYSVENTIERNVCEPITSDYAYHGNYQNYMVGMSAKEYETFKTLMLKL